MAHSTASSTRTFAKLQRAMSARPRRGRAISAPRLLSRAAGPLREMAHRHTRTTSFDRVLIRPQHRTTTHSRSECSRRGLRTAMALDRFDKEHVEQWPCCGPAAACSQQLDYQSIPLVRRCPAPTA
ncbi:hypothetical protein GY45DRAFT_1316254 [Cubamyces sp. BRFM 1775]|nr:hypothetical protein GY45DRAFT_1316254 [Cubamyces sp. BRFM 1775]